MFQFCRCGNKNDKNKRPRKNNNNKLISSLLQKTYKLLCRMIIFKIDISCFDTYSHHGFTTFLIIIPHT